MTRILSALILAAVTATATVPAAVAMEQEFNMLTGAVYHELSKRGIDTSGINDLTLDQIALIRGVIDSGESEGNIKNRIEAIMAQ